MRQLLKNAKVYDGTSADPIQADLLLEEDRIVKIAPGLNVPAEQVFDLKGCAARSACCLRRVCKSKALAILS